MVLCYNFCQALPVIPKCISAHVVGACLKASLIWNNVEKLSFSTNMRVVISDNSCDTDCGTYPGYKKQQS